MTASCLLLLAPALAAACPIEFRAIGPVSINRVDVKTPTLRAVDRSAWNLDETWRSSEPELNQTILVRGGRSYEGASYASQRALAIDAAAPTERGWTYADDDDESTPPCAIAGQGEWQPPQVFVKEERGRVRVAAATQRTVGDRTGCLLGGDQDAADWGCPTLSRVVVRLKQPLGKRSLVFETFA